MVLKISSKLISNAISKDIGVSEVFFKENFKVEPYDKSSAFVVVLLQS